MGTMWMMMTGIENGDRAIDTNLRNDCVQRRSRRTLIGPAIEEHYTSGDTSRNATLMTSTLPPREG